MATRKVDTGTRVILVTAAVVLGLAVGIVVLAVLNSRGGGEAPPYQPFFAGQSDQVTKQIKEGGPVCFQDPKEGQRSFCLDLHGDNQIIALHVIPPDGTAACLVKWDRTEKRYEDCDERPVDRATLARFPVHTKEIGGKISVFVDVRTTAPPPAAPAG